MPPEPNQGRPAITAATLVLGIGNTLLTDEGVGVHVITHLQESQPSRPGVTYLDGGTLSFTLAGAIADHQSLVVVDAAELHAPPGAIRAFAGVDMDEFLGRPRRSVHEVSLIDLLNISRLTDRLPARRALVGIQPSATGWGDWPTPAVAEAIPKAAEVVRRLIDSWLSEPLNRGVIDLDQFL